MVENDSMTNWQQRKKWQGPKWPWNNTSDALFRFQNHLGRMRWNRQAFWNFVRTLCTGIPGSVQCLVHDQLAQWPYSLSGLDWLWVHDSPWKAGNKEAAARGSKNVNSTAGENCIGRWFRRKRGNRSFQGNQEGLTLNHGGFQSRGKSSQNWPSQEDILKPLMKHNKGQSWLSNFFFFLSV